MKKSPSGLEYVNLVVAINCTVSQNRNNCIASVYIQIQFQLINWEHNYSCILLTEKFSVREPCPTVGTADVCIILVSNSKEGRQLAFLFSLLLLESNHRICAWELPLKTPHHLLSQYLRSCVLCVCLQLMILTKPSSGTVWPAVYRWGCSLVKPRFSG